MANRITTRLSFQQWKIFVYSILFIFLGTYLYFYVIDQLTQQSSDYVRQLIFFVAFVVIVLFIEMK